MSGSWFKQNSKRHEREICIKFDSPPFSAILKGFGWRRGAFQAERWWGGGEEKVSVMARKKEESVEIGGKWDDGKVKRKERMRKVER